jgi:hypothetical protein
MQIFLPGALASTMQNPVLFSKWKDTTDPNAAWSDWANLGGPQRGVVLPSIGYLPDRRMQLFSTADSGYSSWQTDPNANFSWSEWLSMGDAPPPVWQSGSYTVGYLPDQRMQLFDIGSDRALYSRWKIATDPNSAWSDWVSLGAPGNADDIGGPDLALGYLTDNRMQLFYSHLNLYSMWKTGVDPDSPWSPWATILVAKGPGPDTTFTSGSVAVGYLPDGTMQLFVLGVVVGDPTGTVTLYSRSKTSRDPNSAWGDWQNLGNIEHDTIRSIDAGYLPDSSMQLFATTEVSQTIYSKWKLNNDPSSAWSDWTSMGPLPSKTAGNAFLTGSAFLGVSIGYLPS